MHTVEARDIRPAWEATTRPFSQGQANLIAEMMKERGITAEELTKQFPAKPTTFEQGSAVIGWIKLYKRDEPTSPAPAPQALPVNEDKNGKPQRTHYALRGEDGIVKFYSVKASRRPGYYFVDVQASDAYYPVRNYGARTAIIAKIADDPKAAMALYGQEIGRCGMCHRKLTSEYRKLGIGPVCIDK